MIRLGSTRRMPSLAQFNARERPNARHIIGECDEWAAVASLLHSWLERWPQHKRCCFGASDATRHRSRVLGWSTKNHPLRCCSSHGFCKTVSLNVMTCIQANPTRQATRLWHKQMFLQRALLVPGTHTIYFHKSLLRKIIPSISVRASSWYDRFASDPVWILLFEECIAGLATAW
jgi:hypothetical protein